MWIKWLHWSILLTVIKFQLQFSQNFCGKNVDQCFCFLHFNLFNQLQLFNNWDRFSSACHITDIICFPVTEWNTQKDGTAIQQTVCVSLSSESPFIGETSFHLHFLSQTQGFRAPYNFWEPLHWLEVCWPLVNVVCLSFCAKNQTWEQPVC